MPPGLYSIEARNLIRNPTTPITLMPRTLILIESQSSSRPGFVASFKVLAACDSHDRKPILTEKNIPVRNNKHYCGIRICLEFVAFFDVCLGFASGYVGLFGS